MHALRERALRCFRKLYQVEFGLSFSRPLRLKGLRRKMSRIRVAVVGVGNCASALVQGTHYYSKPEHSESHGGLLRPTIGPYSVNDIDFVVGFDVDVRKIGLPLKEAIFQKPNCCAPLSPDVRFDASGRFDGMVFSAPQYDGVADHMHTNSIDDSERFMTNYTCGQPALSGSFAPGYVTGCLLSGLGSSTLCSGACYASGCASGCNLSYTSGCTTGCTGYTSGYTSGFDGETIWPDHSVQTFAKKLQALGVTALVNYLPVGSQRATEFWASVCIQAKVSMVNCIPVFIASNVAWGQRFLEAGVAIIGDDMKSQFGASVLSQAFQELAEQRGHKVKVHIQQNSGGNTDFLNMTDQGRLKSKKISKENVLRDHGSKPDFLHAGPSDYIRIYQDTKVAHFHLELEGFCGAPVKLDARLEVQDSPNSAGVVIDALRYVSVAQANGIYGALNGPSAFTQKSPPVHMPLSEAIKACDALASLQ